MLVVKGENNIVPNGATVISAGDKLLVLANEVVTKDVIKLLASVHPDEQQAVAALS